MIYIYDRILEDKPIEINYLDTVYKFVGKNVLDDFEYYAFKNADSEIILVIQAFALEFEEAAQLFTLIKKATTEKAVTMRIQDKFQTVPQVERFQAGGDEICTFEVDYKHIRIFMQLKDKQLTLLPDFTIVDGNVFGNYISVDVRNNPKLSRYCQ